MSAQVLTSAIGRTLLLTGLGSFSLLPSRLAGDGVRRVLVVTDPVVSALPPFEHFRDAAERVGLGVVLFTEVTPNPKDVEVMAGAAVFRAEDCDAVIAVGGGSVMDAAKGIALMARHDGDIMEYARSRGDARRPMTNGRAGLVCVPTTGGTGSEMSPHAVINDTVRLRKSDVQGDVLYPDLAVLDPELSRTLPRAVTLESGVDALCHAVEVFTSRACQVAYVPAHDAVALESIRLNCRHLARACYCGDFDLRAREAMLWAANLSGVALSLDVSAGHALAGPLQAAHPGMAHGISVGILLIPVMEHNLPAIPDRFAQIAAALGVDTAGMDPLVAGRAAIDRIRGLMRAVEFPAWSSLTSTTPDFSALAEAGSRTTTLRNNPRPVTRDDAREIYQRAWAETFR